jgi:hypothetical protein
MMSKLESSEMDLTQLGNPSMSGFAGMAELKIITEVG